MLYVATERASWLLIGVGLFAAGAFVAYKAIAHVTARVDVWLDPFHYRNGSSHTSTRAVTCEMAL